MNRVCEINEVEYSVKNENITLLNINEQWLKENNINNGLRDVLITLTNKIIDDNNNFFVKQKIIALTNLFISIKKIYVEDLKNINKDELGLIQDTKNNIYKLNLVIKNLKTLRDSGEYIRTNEKKIVINSLIVMVFSSGYLKVLKTILNTNKQENIK